MVTQKDKNDSDSDRKRNLARFSDEDGPEDADSTSNSSKKIKL
jgi:hypothetical protein